MEGVIDHWIFDDNSVFRFFFLEGKFSELRFFIKFMFSKQQGFDGLAIDGGEGIVKDIIFPSSNTVLPVRHDLFL